jgi:hypothetical protein
VSQSKAFGETRNAGGVVFRETAPTGTILNTLTVFAQMPILKVMGRLERRAAGTWLDGKRVEHGAVLELRLPRGHWLPGRYERSADRRPALRVVLGGDWEAARVAPKPTALLEIATDAELRWRDPHRFEPEPTLPMHAKAILGALIGAHPSRLSRVELAQVVGLLDNSAVFETSLRILRSSRLVIADGAFLVVNARLFRSLE